nr:MAG TPA: hypothetical protein [Caudoviricetes sp.]
MYLFIISLVYSGIESAVLLSPLLFQRNKSHTRHAEK